MQILYNFFFLLNSLIYLSVFSVYFYFSIFFFTFQTHKFTTQVESKPFQMGDFQWWTVNFEDPVEQSWLQFVVPFSFFLLFVPNGTCFDVCSLLIFLQGFSVIFWFEDIKKRIFFVLCFQVIVFIEENEKQNFIKIINIFMVFYSLKIFLR